jgi:hypothetical protein
MTVIASLRQSMSDDQLVLLGRGWSLDRLSVVLLYLTGVVGLILMLTSIYRCHTAEGTHLTTPCPVRRHCRRLVVGGHSPHPALVFFDVVSGGRGLLGHEIGAMRYAGN